jgi:hypothetical protein
VTPTTLPRMADFAIWVMAGEDALGMRPGEFERAYAGNREEAVEEALEASPIYRPFCEAFQGEVWWEGTASDLLNMLNERATDAEKRQYGWPKTPTKMGNIMKRLAPALRNVRWEVKTGLRGSGGRRVIRIERAGKEASLVSQAPQAAENMGKSALSGSVTFKAPSVTSVTGAAPQSDARGDTGDIRCHQGVQASATTQTTKGQRLTAKSDVGDTSDAKNCTLSSAGAAAQHGSPLHPHKADGQAGSSPEERPDDLSDLFEEYTSDKEWRSL